MALGNAVFEWFGADLAAKRFDAAYARMAEPYRAAFTFEAFLRAAVTLLVEHGDARILVLSLGGIPVLDGVSGPAQ